MFQEMAGAISKIIELTAIGTAATAARAPPAMAKFDTCFPRFAPMHSVNAWIQVQMKIISDIK